MNKVSERPLNLVIADDDSDDHLIMQKAIWETNANHKITSVYNGLQLMDYLLRKGAYKDCEDPVPDCIFLDLNMPLMDGLEALTQIKKKPETQSIPIFIFSTNNSIKEKQKLLASGAKACFFTSPRNNNLKRIVTEVLRSLTPHAPRVTSIKSK
ncbi:MAG: response regulator [Bacteroidetes bacterium]|nr:response regulator [Bacteroidota bacterium]